MTTKEARRVYVMEQVLEGKLTIRLAAEHLNLSERQVKRLKKILQKVGLSKVLCVSRMPNRKSFDIEIRVVEMAKQILARIGLQLH